MAKNEACNFCKKTKSEVELLIAGTDGNYICNECVALSAEIIHDNKFKKKMTEANSALESAIFFDPRKIKDHLDKTVEGQEEAKISLSIAVSNHYKRLINPKLKDDKSNVLMVGPSGCGKTHLARALSTLLDVPFAVCDATSLTEAGYVGEDVEAIIHKLLIQADYDVEKVEQGIVFIDEIDKIGIKAENASITRDVSGEGVQQSLLKMVEGSVIQVPINGGRKHPQAEMVSVDTSKMLFIGSGAFAGLEDIINKRKNPSRGISLVSKNTDSEITSREMKDLTNADLKEFGLIPELLGRLPVKVKLSPISENMMINIVSKVEGNIVQLVRERFRSNGVDIKFDKAFVQEIASRAMGEETGARAVREIFESTIRDLSFNIANYKEGTKLIGTYKGEFRFVDVTNIEKAS